jgi:hypothetical protein
VFTYATMLVTCDDLHDFMKLPSSVESAWESKKRTMMNSRRIFRDYSKFQILESIGTISILISMCNYFVFKHAELVEN